MPLRLVGPADQPPEPRCIVLRSVGEVPAALAVANADIPVMLVLRVDELDRQRVVDMITGWTSAAQVTPDWLGAHTVVLRTARAPQVRLIAHGMAAAVERALATDVPKPLTRNDEVHLRRLAASGDVDARRRLIDAYAELTTLVALWLRPPSRSAEWAVHLAQRELDVLVGIRSKAPLLVELVNLIATQMAAPALLEPDQRDGDES
jgi:hypothetical protein